MKKILSLIGFILISYFSFSTHNRAGEITYRQISDLTYEITIITYTSTGPGWTADRPELEVLWGDNTRSVLPRIEEVRLPDYYKRNKYVGTHTYPGPGIYVIVVEDPNRNEGVNNIPNSVNTVFTISTTMMINSSIGYNNTPILTQPPVDKAALGQVFIHNPGAYDPDGDSLSYKLTPCRADNGLPIEGYTLPVASHSLSINPINGDLLWDTPTQIGVYNIAMLIEEWRHGIKIGEIIRDMQIEVYAMNNKPPEITAATSVCVDVDSVLKINVLANDEDNDSIKLTATGAALIAPNSNAYFLQTHSEAGLAKGEFYWIPTCSHIRKQAYNINIKAADNHNPINLVDIHNISILVVGPKVKDFQVHSTAVSLNLTWTASTCPNVIGYNIYRRISASNFIPAICQVGVPPETGYEKIVFVRGINNLSYEDFNLAQGHEYCYLICAVFPDGAEGYASDEVCAVLERGIPTITNVSVVKTDEALGEIYIAWSKPKEIDTINAPGPYQYVLYRSLYQDFSNNEQIAVFNSLNDTIFYDKNINTKGKQFYYKVELYNNSLNNRFLIGSPHIASSIYLSINQGENSLDLLFNKNVPWINTNYVIYRYNNNTLVYDSITSVSNLNYIDKGLINGKEYCYYIKSIGYYSVSGLIRPIINLSQINCMQSVDTTPPCAPHLFVNSLCDSLSNYISWVYPDSCSNDVNEFYLYFSPFLSSELVLLQKFKSTEFSFVHYPNNSLAGCYAIIAVDSFLNKSSFSNKICVDECSFYKLPNVFTPNGDGINDIYTPIMPYYFVSKVEMKIYSRWGLLVYETTNPDINWNGNNYRNNQLVTSGVYFYNCDVYEQRLTGIEVRHLSGFIHVIYDSETKSNNIINE